MLLAIDESASAPVRVQARREVRAGQHLVYTKRNVVLNS
jgi:hypothetical protein